MGIFYGKGKCSTCHTLGPSATPGRCPDLENVAVKVVSRKPGVSAKEYFIESLYDPWAYRVEGYGKIMPPIWKPPIALSPLEIETVIAFLQSQGGEVDVSSFQPPVDISTVASAETSERILTGNPAAGKIVFEEKLKCLSCHTLGEVGGTGEGYEESVTAPDLADIAALNTIDYIEESILYPNAIIVTGYGWADFRLESGDRLEGTLKSETDSEVTLQIGDEESVIAKDDIKIGKISKRRMKDVLGSGYFWVQATLNDGTSVEGTVSGEDEATLTVKVGEELTEISKDNIDKLQGKRIRITSKMPTNFAYLLTVNDFNDLLAYVASLKGEVVP